MLAIILAIVPGWSASFPPASLAVWVDGVSSYAVVSAGDGADGAATALRTALRASGRAELVVDDRGLGRVETLDDAAIVERAALLTVMRVAIVRVAGDRATTRVYDKAGTLVTTFAAQRGEPLRAPWPLPAEYEQKFIGFDELFELRNGVVLERETLYYRGIDKEPLSGAALYAELERSDLATRYNRRLALKWTLGTAGALSLLGGAFLAFERCDWRACPLNPTGRPHWVPGVLLVGAGALLFVAGVGISAEPVDSTETRRLVGEHNRALRDNLAPPAH